MSRCRDVTLNYFILILFHRFKEKNTTHCMIEKLILYGIETTWPVAPADVQQGDGVIDKKELLAVFSSLGLQISDKELKAMFESAETWTRTAPCSVVSNMRNMFVSQRREILKDSSGIRD